MTTDTLEKIDFWKAAQVDYLPLLTLEDMMTTKPTDWGQLYTLDETQAVPGYTNATASTIMETLTAEMMAMPTQLSPLSPDYWVSMSGSINQLGVTLNSVATEIAKITALMQKAAFGWDEETVDQEGFDAIREQLATALDKLVSSGSVADFLRHEGITGVPTAGRRCPIARWLSGVLGREVSVSPQAVYVAVRDSDGKQLEVEMPIAARAFVREFDRGQHPDLIELPEDTAFIPAATPDFKQQMNALSFNGGAVYMTPTMTMTNMSMNLCGALV